MWACLCIAWLKQTIYKGGATSAEMLSCKEQIVLLSYIMPHIEGVVQVIVLCLGVQVCSLFVFTVPPPHPP